VTVTNFRLSIDYRTLRLIRLEWQQRVYCVEKVGSLGNY